MQIPNDVISSFGFTSSSLLSFMVWVSLTIVGWLHLHLVLHIYIFILSGKSVSLPETCVEVFWSLSDSKRSPCPFLNQSL